MRVLTAKDGDLSSHFDKLFENIDIKTSLNGIFMGNQTTYANKGKIFPVLRLEQFFGFC